MPTPPTAKWPKPRSEDEFEDMAVDFLRIRWQDPHATRHGRRGQAQDGVDIVGHPPRLNGRVAGAQCKNTDSMTLDVICAEVEKAKRFRGGLAEFLIVTTAERNASLQNEVREYFKTQPATFHVEVIYWPDVVADLSTDPRVVEKHWKGFPEGTPQPKALPAPILIGRDGVHDEETSECQCEFTVLAPGLDLESGELTSQLSQLVLHERHPSDSLLADVTVRALLSRAPSRTGERYIWSSWSRIASNVIIKHELEVGGGGILSYRWAEFTSNDIICLRTSLLTLGVLAPLMLHKVALARVVQSLALPNPTKITARLAVHGSGELLLLDDMRIIEAFLFSTPLSPSDWSIELETPRDTPLHRLGLRILNRALSRFNATGTTVLQVKEAEISRLLAEETR